MIIYINTENAMHSGNTSQIDLNKKMLMLYCNGCGKTKYSNELIKLWLDIDVLWIDEH